MKYNIVFSIPIHERFEVVIDLILNFFHFNKDCAIVFHISQGFNYADSKLSKESFLDIIKSIGNVFINPESVRTGRDDIIQAHISNFNYINRIADFEFFCMCASNELFVKPGLFDYIKENDCGVSFIDIDKRKYNDWTPGIKARKDPDLNKYLNTQQVVKIYGSHIEGSYYKRVLFEEIVNEISLFYDYKAMPFAYPRDEIYFSTVLWVIINKKHSVKISDDGIFCYVRWYSNVDYKIWIWDIKHLQKRKGLYSVKRVDRVMDARLREYARRLFGYYETELSLGLLDYQAESIYVIRRKEIKDFVISYLKAIKIAIPYYLSRVFSR